MIRRADLPVFNPRSGMKNAELHIAIQSARENWSCSTGDVAEMFKKHLAQLLEIQCARAAMTP